MTVTVTQIAPRGDSYSFAIGINNQGMVTGFDYGGFVWQNGTVTWLADDAQPSAINNAGLVVGQTPQGLSATYQNGAETLLPNTIASPYNYAQGINDSGEIVGLAQTNSSSGAFVGVVWQQGQETVLPSLGSGNTKPNAINASGEIVGFSSATTAYGTSHAVSWINGALTDLGTLPGDTDSLANGVNNQGEIAGTSGNYNKATVNAVVWINGKINALPSLPGSSGGFAYNLNNEGVVVGFVDVSSRTSHAVAWINGGIVDLNSLLAPNSGWVLNSAVAINDQNQVVGAATYNGAYTSFLLTLPGNVAPILTAATAIGDGSTLISGSSIGDSAANIGASIDQIETLFISGKLTSVALTDSGTPNLTVTAAQFSTDAPVLNAISGAHSVTVQVAGNASQHDFSADHWAGVSALQFADQTVFVAATPGPASAVTTGNVTELYSAVLAREPDVGGLAYYQNYLKTNPSTPLQTFADYFLNSAEYKSHHSYAVGTAGDTQFITDSYQNLLHRTPSPDEVNFYLTNVMSKPDAHALMLVYFSASPEFLFDVQITAQNPASAQHWLLLT